MNPIYRLVARLFSLYLLAASLPVHAADQEVVVQLVEYIGADYPSAVAAGEIINADEYGEMREFSERVVEGVAALPDAPGKPALQEQALALREAVAAMADTQRVRALTSGMQGALVDSYGITVLPRAMPDMGEIEALYDTHCAACHGSDGRGDGPAAAGMEPPPVNFLDQERHDARSLLGLYATITDGVEGTAMVGFEALLTEAQRWALAFHTGGMAVDQARDARGGEALAESASLRNALTLQVVLTRSPADVRTALGDVGHAALGHLRRHPEALFNDNRFIELSRNNLQQARAAYEAGERGVARDAALSAYLDGFEMIEQQLSTVDATLMRRVERQFMAVREAIESDRSPDEVAQTVDAAIAALLEARDALGGEGLGAGATFAASFVILFREGLEALLIVATLLTFTRKAGAQRATRYIHLGWTAALVAGVFTWFVATALISFSGASREVTEGVGGLLAAGILFYVGFWMHSNGSNRQWLDYLKAKVEGAVTGGTLWALVGIAFISVYREMFETILFYQALWSQVAEGIRMYLLYGVLAALTVLAVLGALIFRIGMRLPLGTFFRATSVVLLVLAVVLLGKGINALQEAGWLGAAYLDLPTLGWIGFHPTVQGVVAQLAAVVLAVFVWQRTSRGRQ